MNPTHVTRHSIYLRDRVAIRGRRTPAFANGTFVSREEIAISASASFPTLSGTPPLVIAHRGASGYLPEHTLQSYQKAIELGADFIGVDLVATKDGVLIARHEPWLTATTNIASHPEFADRKTVRVVDGHEICDWFASDFALEEIKSLRAMQPFAMRDQSFNAMFQIPTLVEIVELAKASTLAQKRVIGVYPETKHPTYHREIGLPLEDRLLAVLADAGWTERISPVIVQSFEIANLKVIRSRSDVRLLQLIGKPDERPHDFVVAGESRSYLSLVTDSLDEIASYANGLGVSKEYLLVPESNDNLSASKLVSRAHGCSLFVHAYTFRDEPQFQKACFGGNPMAEYKAFYALGVDGVFSDFPDSAISARQSFAAQKT